MFVPVMHQAMLRTFLVVVEKQKMFVHVKIACLNGELEKDAWKDLYMRQPPGQQESGQEELVFYLNRSIYGLRHTMRCWSRKLQAVLLKLGFSPLLQISVCL